MRITPRFPQMTTILVTLGNALVQVDKQPETAEGGGCSVQLPDVNLNNCEAGWYWKKVWLHQKICLWMNKA